MSNDFFEDDYLYINQKNGSFKEQSHKYLSQTSQFSMGNDISDINHDGLVDIITLNVPEDEKVLKNSLGEINYNSLVRRKSLGYNYQFPRNHLQINTGVDKFFEIGLFQEYQPLIGVGLLFLRILITMDTKIWSFLMEFIEDQMMQTTLNTSPLNK